MKYVRLVISLLVMLSFFSIAHASDKEVLSVQISHAYVNNAPPGVNVAAGFFEIKNTGDAEVDLKGVSSPSAEKMGLHSTDIVNGKMRMKMIEGFTVYAGDTVKLQHGGLHLMLWGLDKSLKPGSYIDLTLHFSGGLKKTVKAEVRDVRAKKSLHHEH